MTDLEREVEQLRGDLERLSQHYQGLMRECDEKDAEIERLRARVESVLEEAQDNWDTLCLAQEVNERLRAAAWSVVRSSFPDKGEVWTYQERVLLDVLEGRDPDAVLSTQSEGTNANVELPFYPSI